MTIQNLKEIIDVLTATSVVSDHGNICAEHDIIYLPWDEKTGDVASKLGELGCHWSSDGECWARFT